MTDRPPAASAARAALLGIAMLSMVIGGGAVAAQSVGAQSPSSTATPSPGTTPGPSTTPTPSTTPSPSSTPSPSTTPSTGPGYGSSASPGTTPSTSAATSSSETPQAQRAQGKPPKGERGKGQRSGGRAEGERRARTAEPAPGFTCDPSRTHGQNVSAYARSLPEGPGRGRAVSQAARSDCGKAR